MNSGRAHRQIQVRLRRTRQTLTATIVWAWASGLTGCGTSPSNHVTPGTGGSGAGTGGSDNGCGGAAVATGGSTGAGGAPAVAALTDEEWTKVRLLSPLPAVPPPDTTNRIADDPLAATLGQRLFFERGFSGILTVGDDGINGGLGPMGASGRIACASCHAGLAMDDDRSGPGNVSLGADFLTRNSPPLVNSTYYRWTNWAGRFSAPWELPIAVVENPKNMNGNRLGVAHVMFNKYRADYEAVFGAGTLEPAIGSDAARFPASAKPKAANTADGPWELMTATDREIVNVILANFGKVLESYMRKLVSGPSAFDRYVGGEASALSAAQIRGLKLFVGDAKCTSCHSGPLLGDNLFHNLGLPQTGPHAPAMDNGRFADVPPLLASAFNTAGAYSDDKTSGRLNDLVSPAPDDTKGQFRTPSLRNVAVTAPYMHAGQLATLGDVVDYYDRVGSVVPAVGALDPLLGDLHLTPEQKADLVAFLASLTGSAVAPALLADTSAP